MLTEFNGREAYLPAVVDRNALPHHYDMYCIENMTAEMPLVNITSPSTSRLATSGTNTSFSTRTDLPATPNSGMGIAMDTGSGVRGDPSKRSRSPQPGQSYSRETAGQNESAEEAEAMLWKEESSGIGERVCKCRRLQGCQVDETRLYHDWVQDDFLGSYITPWNSREFLADVNWELQRLKAR